MCARRSGNILFYCFAENFSGSKDTDPYKTDVSFLCQPKMMLLFRKPAYTVLIKFLSPDYFI